MPRLTARKVETIKEAGRYPDGDGLMLVVGASGSKSWIARLQVDGKRRDIGLGSVKDVSLLEARERAMLVRRQMRDGIDPVSERKRSEARPVTFEEAAGGYIREHCRSWSNPKHAAQWSTTLQAYAYPTLGGVPVAMVTAPSIREAILPIWHDKEETARRVLQRIGVVLDWACAKGLREAGSPVAAVRKALPRQTRLVRHHPAMPYSELSQFMRGLASAPTTAGRLAIRCLVLTACRPGEVRGARWRELDLENQLWSIPAERMKNRRPHVVTLSAPAVAVFRVAEEIRQADDDLVFPGTKRGRPLSDMTLTKVLRDADVPWSVHGFRSSFRDWAAEQSDAPHEVVEKAISHTAGSKVVAAYRRTDFLERRRQLLDEWARYCLKLA